MSSLKPVSESFYDLDCLSSKNLLAEALNWVKQARNEVEKATLLVRFREVRRCHKRLIKVKKRDFNTRQIEQMSRFYLESNMKEFWRRVKQRQGKASEGIPDPNS